MAETVDIEFRAKLDDLKRQLDQMPGLTKRKASEISKVWIDEMKRARKEGGTAIEQAAKEAEKLEKVAGAIGGRVGDAIRTVGTLAKGAGVGLSDMGTKMAIAGAAAGAVALAVAGSVAAFRGAASVVMDVSSRIDELTTALGAGDGTIREYSASIREAGTAFDALSLSTDRLRVTVAGELSPAFESLAYMAVGVVESIRGLVDVAGDAAEAVGGLSSAFWVLLPRVSAAVNTLGLFERIGRAAADAADQQTASVSAAAAQYALMTQGINRGRTAEQVRQVTADISARQREEEIAQAEASRAKADRLREATQKLAEAEQARNETLAQTVQHLRWREQVEAALAEQSDQRAALQAQGAENMARAQSEQASNARMIVQEQISLTDQLVQDGKRAAEAVREVATATAEDWKASIADMGATTIGFSRSFVALADMITDRNASRYAKDSEAYRKHRMKQFRAHKAAAIAEATINTALGVTKTLSSYAYPINIVLAALTLAAGIADIAVISGQQPTFHVGGVVQAGKAARGAAPDEVDARLMQGEGVLTRRGVAALGGPDGVQAANRGAPAAGTSQVVAVAALDGRVLDAVWSGRGPSATGGLGSRMDSRLRGGLAGRSRRWG